MPVDRPQPDVLEPLDPTSFTYSVVVPVYNSEGIVGTTVDRIVAEFEQQGLSYELILVNDGSGDRSWEVISGKADQNPHVVALNLLRNYGQHNANLAGFREARATTSSRWTTTCRTRLTRCGCSSTRR